MKTFTKPLRHGATLGAALLLSTSLAQADQVFLDDVIVDGSLCVGIDCVNGENFGFDTIRMKENNLRIKAQDTSTSGSFPTVDWQITFNDSANGGQNKFAIDDIDNARTPFTIESGVRSNQLYLADNNKVGFGTSTPVVDLHVKQGNTPTLRLEQDGSSGFSAQTFDIAANETNFFIRDATNGSTLPFRIQPGAPTNAIYIADDGNIGMGAGTNPEEKLHVDGGNILVEDSGAVNVTFRDTSDPGNDVRFQHTAGEMRVSFIGSGATEMILREGGDMVVAGNYISNGVTLNVPDYVFQEGYELMPLSQVEAFITANSHLPKIPSAAQIAEKGINMSEMQMALLEKIEELTLYTLDQEKRISDLTARLDAVQTAD